MIVGTLLVLLAILAYPLGLAHTSGFGWRRTLAVIVGLLVILVGNWWRRNLGASS